MHMPDHGSSLGYNFPSLAAITPYLEPTASGPSTDWAKRTAKRLDSLVSVGYPEVASTDRRQLSSLSSTITDEGGDDVPREENLPTNVHPDQDLGLHSTSNGEDRHIIKRYNSTVTVSPAGDIQAHYRKTHLYFTDESWATASPSKFLTTNLSFPSLSSLLNSTSPRLPPLTQKNRSADGTNHVKHVAPDDYTPKATDASNPKLTTTFGICMDLNPNAFTAPWSSYELATHTLLSHSQLLIISMAWCTHEPTSLPSNSSDIHLESMSYWISRLKPLIDAEEEIVVVIANRCGMEKAEEGGEEDVHYVGSSWIGKVGKGEVKIWGILGCGEEAVLKVDTEEEPKFRVVARVT